MKRGVTNWSKIMFWGGLVFLTFSFILLLVDSQTGYLTLKMLKTNKTITQAQIRDQRLAAINNAISEGVDSYRFEVPGANIINMPMLPEEGLGQK